MLGPFNYDLRLDLLPPLTGDTNIDLGNLQSFLEHLYHPHPDASMYTQLYVCIGVVCALLLVGVVVLLHRYFYGRAWVFKVWQVAGGTFVIPNSVIAFTICQGAFGVAWIIYATIAIRHYRGQSTPGAYFFWRSLTWVPLWDGAWWLAFGVFSAFPDALTSKSKISKQKRLILSPSSFNLICWGTPVVQACSILPLAIVTARKTDSTAMRFHAWREDVLSAQNGSLSDAATAPLYSEGLKLWLDYTRIYWYMGIIMAMWCLWAIVVFFVHLPVGAHTILRIRTALQVATCKKQVEDGRIKAETVDLSKGWVKDLFDPKSVQHRPEDVGRSTITVFPPSRTQASLPRQPTSYCSPEERRVRILKKLSRNLTVQFVGISAGIVTFFFASGTEALGLYNAVRNGDTCKFEEASILIAAWSAVIFGCLLAFCLAQRSFDPSLSIDVPDEEASRIAPRVVWSGFLGSRFGRRLVVSGNRRSTSRTGRDGAANTAPTTNDSTLAVSQIDCTMRSGSWSQSRTTENLSGGEKESIRTSKANIYVFPGQPSPSKSDTGYTVRSEATPLSPSQVYFVTPFGKVPLIAPERPCQVAAHDVISSTQLVARSEDERALSGAYSLCSLNPRDGSTHQLSVSSSDLRGGSKSRSSSMSVSPYLTPSKYPHHPDPKRRPGSSNSVAPGRSASCSQTWKRHTMSASRSSSHDADPGMLQSVPPLDKCFIRHESVAEKHSGQAQHVGEKAGVDGGGRRFQPTASLP